MVNELDQILEIAKTPTPPPIPPEGTKEYGGIQRVGYWLGMFGVNIVNILSIMFSLRGEPGLALIGSLIAIVLSFFLVVSRLHNIGMSGWWSLLMLVPIANLIVHVRCLICPEGYQDTRKLDTAGKVLAWLFVTCLASVVIVAMLVALAS